MLRLLTARIPLAVALLDLHRAFISSWRCMAYRQFDRQITNLGQVCPDGPSAILRRARPRRRANGGGAESGASGAILAWLIRTLAVVGAVGSCWRTLPHYPR